jgi:hypothetical protein
MPHIVPKPREVLPPAPIAPPPEPGITRAELDAILAERDAMWAKLLDTTTRVLMASIPKPQAPTPRKPIKVKFDLDNRNNPTGFTITPEN